MEQMSVLVIIPVYNKERGVRRAVESVINQSYRKFEIVIVDDASNDDSLKIINSLANEHKQITVISHDENMGRSIARNTGMDAKHATYVAFLDADDSYSKDFLQITTNVLNKNPELDAIKVGINLPVEIEREKYLALYNSSAANMIFRKNILSFLGGFPEDEAYQSEFGGEDIALNQLFSPPFKMGAIEDKLYNYYPDEDSHFYKFINRSKVINGRLHVEPSKHDWITQNAMKKNMHDRNLRIRELVARVGSVNSSIV